MTSLEDFLGKKSKDFTPEGDQVNGTFTCMDCGSVTQDAVLNYEQKYLMWICQNCNHVNRVGMNV